MDPDPLRWLRRARWALIAAELGFVALGAAGVLPAPPPVPALAVCAALAAFDLTVRASVPAHVLVDAAALSALVAAAPDAHQPLQALLLVEPAVAATALAPRAAVGLAAAAVATQVLALVGARHDPELAHLTAHAVLLGTAAIGAAALVSRLAAAGRAAEAARREADAARAAAERLAALGTLAADVAHELATPLAAIGVLADELALGEGDRAATLAALQGQIERGHALLRRLKTGPGELDARTDDVAGQLAAWVSAWQAANGVPVAVTTPAACPTARGDPARWRAALWTVLDNARRAGGPIRVHVDVVRAGAPHLRVDVDDGGPGVAPATAARAGEPFFSAWADGAPGHGLGLFAARAFARAVGGDLTLAGLPGGGARATLRMPVEGG